MLSGSLTYTGRRGRSERIKVLIGAGAAALGLTLAACGDDGLGPICTAEAVFGLNLTVRDGLGVPAAQGALGIAVDGSFADTLMVLGDTELAGAVERPGTYDIAVSKPGHVSWSATGVTVLSNECHVIPVQMDVNLVATP